MKERNQNSGFRSEDRIPDAKKTDNASSAGCDELLTSRGLERRLKRHLAKKECAFFAIAVPGFESILKSEISRLPDVKAGECIDGGVLFSGALDTVYNANLHLRTANRVLLRIDTFTARSYPELYNKAKKIDWELYCGFTSEISFSVSSRTSRLHHTENIENAVFDGLAEVMGRLGVKVTNKKSAAIRFFIRFSDDVCTISIDSSGELLYRRGYRTEVAHAPIRETTAAALLVASEWSNYNLIADPMCGSGTFLLESYLLASGTAPGCTRKFAFEKWPSFSESKWDRIKRAAQSSVTVKPAVRLIASDCDAEAVRAAKVNITNLGCQECVELSQKDCFEFNRNGEYGKSGLIVSNLPYGKRVGESDELNTLYKKLGEHYRTYCNGWRFGFIAADWNFPKISKLKVKSELRFVNGGIPVTFYMGMF